ncbi:hypothetical protein GCM10010350_80590 [Streptomyces galilaeus]|nr:hypothetical protein GCM10010350_80590 [Streptomyces galilaeus]
MRGRSAPAPVASAGWRGYKRRVQWLTILALLVLLVWSRAGGGNERGHPNDPDLSLRRKINGLLVSQSRAGVHPSSAEATVLPVRAWMTA